MQERKTNDYKIYMMLYLKGKDIKETAVSIFNKVKPPNIPTCENFTKGLRSLSRNVAILRTILRCRIWHEEVRKKYTYCPAKQQFNSENCSLEIIEHCSKYL